jgi:hypothetical protein
MEKEENKSGSVYVTVDGHFNPIHISMKGRVKKAFWISCRKMWKRL